MHREPTEAEDYDDEDNASRLSLLFGNFVQYVNDNVFMMALACTVGSIGESIRSCWFAEHPVLGSLICLLIDLIIIGIMRRILLALFRGTTSSSDLHDASSHMLEALPWVVRVPTSALVSDLTVEIHSTWAGYADNADTADVHAAGRAFTLSFCVFLCLDALLVGFMYWDSALEDHLQPDRSWQTFWVRVVTLGLTSGAGKALHLLLAVLVQTFVLVRVDSATLTLAQQADLLCGWGVAQAIQLVVALFTLGWVVPLIRTSPKVLVSNELTIGIRVMEYVVGYAWSFSVADFLWVLVVQFVGGGLLGSPALGFGLFCVASVAGLAPATALAWSVPDCSYYDMHGSHWKFGLALLCFWYVDFMTWWAWAAVMVDLDALVGGSTDECAWTGVRGQAVVLANLGTLVGWFTLVGGVHLVNADAVRALLPWQVVGRKVHFRQQFALEPADLHVEANAPVMEHSCDTHAAVAEREEARLNASEEASSRASSRSSPRASARASARTSRWSRGAPRDPKAFPLLADHVDSWGAAVGETSNEQEAHLADEARCDDEVRRDEACARNELSRSRSQRRRRQED